MGSRQERDKVEREILNVRFLYLTIYGRGYEDGKECDLREAATILRTSMKQVAEALEIGNGVATIDDYDVYQAKVG